MRSIDPIAELRRIMQDRNLSQGKLADEIGIDRGYALEEQRRLTACAAASIS